MERVAALLHENIADIAKRLQASAKRGKIVPPPGSQLSWETMVSGFTLPLLFSLELCFTPTSHLLHNGSDDPAVDFVLSVAATHRKRGVSLHSMRKVVQELRDAYIELSWRLEGDDRLVHTLEPVLEALFERIDAALAAAAEADAAAPAEELEPTMELELLQRVFHRMPQPVLVLDRDERVRLINRSAAAAFYGRSEVNSLIGRRCAQLSQVLSSFRASGGSEDSLGVTVGTADGPRHFEISVAPLSDCGGADLLIIMNIATEAQKVDNVLEQQLKTGTEEPPFATT